MSVLTELLIKALTDYENQVNGQIQKLQQEAADQKAKQVQLSADLASEKAKNTTLQKQVTDLTTENAALKTQIAKLEKEMRDTIANRSTVYPARFRGDFAIIAATAQWPKSTNAAAVGGTQTGDEGAIKLGDYWIVSNASGKKFTGMVANFGFDKAIVIATKDGSGNALADWKVEEKGGTLQAPANQSPFAQINSPATGSSSVQGQEITIGFTATDPDGTIASVKLLVNDVEQSLAPVSNQFKFTPTTPGAFAFKVKVRDNLNAETVSNAITVNVTAPASNTRTLIDAVDFRHRDTYVGSSADNTVFDGVTHRFFGTDPSDGEHVPISAGWDRGTLYYNSDPFAGDIIDSDGTSANGSVRHIAYKDFAFNIRSLSRSGLAAGNYELEVYVIRLWANNAVSTLTVNGVNTNLSAPNGPYGIKQVIPFTLSSAGSVVITDKNTVDNPSGEGGINLSFLRIYKIG